MASILRGQSNQPIQFDAVPNVGGTDNVATESAVGVANSALVKTAVNATGTAPIYACRAWVNFNGIGTVAIRASGNVSSITDNGIGNYIVNFTTAMVDANFFVVSNCGSNEAAGTNRYSVTSPKDTSSAYVSCEVATTNVRVDNDLVTCAIFR